MVKNRLDIILVERGLASSREKARGLILAGQVKIDGKIHDKPGLSVSSDADIQVEGPVCPYVSRGGLKLEKAARVFRVNFEDQLVLDIGASTGGYTDFALQNGAARVIAVDVGYGQLDWKLRNDPRVNNLERTNIRYLDPETLGEKVDIVTIDVSFISTSKVFPVVRDLIKPGGQVICLIKPQFEAGRSQVGKKGVVRDPQVHRQVLLDSIEGARTLGLFCHDLTYSPITGPQGNIEYFLLLKPWPDGAIEPGQRVKDIVEESHANLGRKDV